MVVLERPLPTPHEELDVVTTPSGDAVAMVHCNNGASEIAGWAKVFGRFAEAAGTPLAADDVYATLLSEAVDDDTDPDAGGLLSFNYLAGEPVTHVEDGRPLLLRTPDARFTSATSSAPRCTARSPPSRSAWTCCTASRSTSTG
ncbi:hypothetical protein GCM10017714_00120 [Curtobacterium pusillum]